MNDDVTTFAHCAHVLLLVSGRRAVNSRENQRVLAVDLPPVALQRDNVGAGVEHRALHQGPGWLRCGVRHIVLHVSPVQLLRIRNAHGGLLQHSKYYVSKS